jgi:4-diphosphocytidyl-2-C-methyl-D-erythritol kinase
MRAAHAVTARFFMLRQESRCKVNLLLNILGRRPDGYHELETLFLPVPLCDVLSFEKGASGIRLTCDNPTLPVDDSNLVVRAARRFFEAAGLNDAGVNIHLEKRIPLAAGLGGGSGNAAQTLLSLNTLFDRPVDDQRIDELAAGLGSDVNFFLQNGPALASGRGERIEPLPPFDALRGCAILLYHPGFGISTAWAYKALAEHPQQLNGIPGRAKHLAGLFREGRIDEAGRSLYNSLEAPALEKFPILELYQEFFREHGAFGALMSGSGSTTFALFRGLSAAQAAIEPFEAEFGKAGWLKVVEL